MVNARKVLRYIQGDRMIFENIAQNETQPFIVKFIT
jgi:hypothetical protein